MRHQVGTSTAMQAACPVSRPASRSMSRTSTLLSVYPPAPLATGQVRMLEFSREMIV